MEQPKPQPQTDDYVSRPRRSTRGRITGTQVVFVAILAIGLLLTINFSARITRGRAYNDLLVQVEGTNTALRNENIGLQQELEFAQSEAAVEEWAHREAKMRRPGTTIVIPIPGFSVPTPTPIVTPRPAEEDTTPDVPPADLWWSLFFDSEPPW